MKEFYEKIIVIVTILLFLVLLYFCINMFGVMRFRNVQAVSSTDLIEIPEILKNQNPVDINKMIENNKNINIREEMKYEELDLEYTTQYINNENLPSGTIHISQIGINGIQDVITIKKFDGDELISEQIVASNVKKASVNKIVEIGTGKRKESI